MKTDTAIRSDHERTLVKIARDLPPNRVEQLVDFARFLEAQILQEKLLGDEEIDDIEAENAQWEALLATDKGQALLENLARDALAEYQSGQTKPLDFDDEGEISPG